LFGEELAQVEQGLMNRRADATLETTANLAHESEQERTAKGDGRHLDERDQDLGHGVGELVHATTTKTITSATNPNAR
jgi:hypothetical protein